MALIGMMGAAVLAAPFPVLEMNDGARAVTASLAGPAFAYTYRQSIYDVPVREELRALPGGIAIDRAVSPDRRALEYFRWPGEAESAGDQLAWRAPANVTPRLRILVVDGGEQVIRTTRGTVLLERFGAYRSVVVTPGRRPFGVWLWGLLPWA